MAEANVLKATTRWPKGRSVLNRELLQSLALSAFIVMIVVAVRSPYLGDPAADPDEQLYSLMGQAWLNGDIPYRDLWDRKPPGLFALFAGFHWIAGPSPLAYQIPGIACTIASALMIYSLAKRIGTPIGALVVTLLFVLNIPRFFMHLGQSETFLVPIVLAQLMGIRDVLHSDDRAEILRKLCVVMALGGIALQIKYSVLPFCALLAIIATYRLWQIQLGLVRISAWLAVFATLGLLPTILFASYFSAVGEFETFFFANFVSIFLRTQMYQELVNYNLVNLATVIFPLAVYAILSVVTVRDNQERVDRTLFVLVILFTLVGALSLVMLGSPFVHYFGLTLPFICLAAASFFSFHPSRRIFGVLAIVLALWCAGFDEQKTHASSHKAAIATLTNTINAYVPEDECIFIFDGPIILYPRSDRCIPTRYAFSPHLNSFHERSALDVDPTDETARILAAKPGAILVAGTFNTPRYVETVRKRVRDTIVSDYVLAQVTGFYPGTLELYIRADLVPIKPLGTEPLGNEQRGKEQRGIAQTSGISCTINQGGPCQYLTPFAE